MENASLLVSGSDRPSMKAKAAMETMIGCERKKPMVKPCSAVTSTPKPSAAMRPKAAPPQFSAAMNTMAEAAVVMPRLNDNRLPLMVISVMPTATQPMKETAVRTDRMLAGRKKPGVNRVAPTKRTMKAKRATNRIVPGSSARLGVGAAARAADPDRKAARRGSDLSCGGRGATPAR